MHRKPLRERSALIYVLIALIPYSKPNLLLSFKPSQFYWELEKISRYRKSSLYKAYKRGLKRGLIMDQGGVPRLTTLGKKRVVPYVATRLKKDVRLMVIFDIPEANASSRRTFRTLLRQWGFDQIQKSVWASKYDPKEALNEVILELDLKDYVEVYEAARIYPK